MTMAPTVLDQRAAAAQEASLSASSTATSETSGRSSPSRRRLMPTTTSWTAQAQVAQDLDALDGVDLAVEVVHL